MRYSPILTPATLIRRYKRFLFDAVLPDGSEVTGSCPNTGSMRDLTTPNSTVWLMSHDQSTPRKYNLSLELVESDNTLVGINTSQPNKLVAEAIQGNGIPALKGYTTIQTEKKYGANSRIDFLLKSDGRPDAYLEVKNVHYMRAKGIAESPDSPTVRGSKHLDELAEIARNGYRAIMLYVIQRNDCHTLRICNDFDPIYADKYINARKAGVEAYAVKCSISPTEIVISSTVRIDDN